MKSLIVLIIISLVFMASQAIAQPFLVCDDAEIVNVTYYVIDIDGTEYTTPYPLRLDLVGLSSGSHTVIAKAGNAWGESEWSSPPFVFDAALPAVPSGLGLSAE